MEEETGAGVDAVLDVTHEMAEQTRSMFHLDELGAYLTLGNLLKVVMSVVTLLIFYVLYRLVRRFIRRQSESGKMQPHNAAMLGKTLSYIFYVCAGMYVLGLLGVDLGALWGAAGVAGLAVGFAAQTSVSNLISGIFVVGEKALKIGDFIAVDGVMGTVDMIGLLSIQIHTLDNQMVRIPNSTIINETLTNYSHFPIRRLLFTIPVSYDADLRKAVDVASAVPPRCPTVLADPAPLVYYDGLGDDGMQLKVAVWLNGSDLLQTKTDVQIELLNALQKAGIDIPYSHYEVELLPANVPGPEVR